jgi:hypothetical protein
MFVSIDTRVLQFRHSRTLLNSIWKSLTGTGFAGALLAVAVMPSVADEQFIPCSCRTRESWRRSTLVLSTHACRCRFKGVGSRGPFGTVVIVNIDDNVVTKELIPDPPFAGDCSVPARNRVTGPKSAYLQRKDGYSPKPVAGDIASPRSGKVPDLKSGATEAVISTRGEWPNRRGMLRF